jgi:hypothetical protein
MAQPTMTLNGIDERYVALSDRTKAEFKSAA